MANSTEGVTEEVESVSFGFMTSDEVKKLSVVKIDNPNIMDAVQRPMPGGLYDPAMGPLDESSLCKTCGERQYICHGHCGHINLVAITYNPLLFDMLYSILSKTCFFCLHFRASKEEVEKCVHQLKLIAKGDLVGAKNVINSSEELDDSEFSEGSHVSVSSTHRLVDNSVNKSESENNETMHWDSFKFTEAKSVLTTFLKQKPTKCSKSNCGAENPPIRKPTFGWLHMAGLSEGKAVKNIMNGHKLFGGYTSNTSEKSSSEVVNDFERTEINSHDETETLRTDNIMEGVSQDINMKKTRPLLPSDVRDILKQLWENEAPLCSLIRDIQYKQVSKSCDISGYFMFFLETILVPPTKFRPQAKGGDSVMEHAHTAILGKVLASNSALRNAHVNKVEGSKIVNRWMELQQTINVLFNSKSGTGKQEASSGICQILEKKEGIFRQKMMGKRVNFACRSVISPDPYLAVNEIGVPPYFALRLTYPEKVTPWNSGKLREAIINGPDIHPGALKYTDQITVKLPASKKARIAISRKLPSSSGVVTGKNEFEGKIVQRHLQDGDIVLVNRQPTLHKPSIMAHVVRVLKGEKTLRMHYANCSSYNADFDGDEMNVHFPQDEISRAEAYNIVNANEQYIVPTKGDTVRGLIQDHIVSAVLLTMKNRFLNREEFNQLLYSSGVFASGHYSSSNNSRKVSLVHSEHIMESILPAILKPKPLWTGKQVITALLNHLTKGYAPCTVESRGKIPYQYFPSGSGKNRLSDEDDKNAENKLLIWKNELVHGVIDKAQFGKYGLVHTVQELYGANVAGVLLSAFSRIFTIFLQTHGFTCGVDDLIILPNYDIERKEELEGEDVGEEVHCDFVNYKPGQIGPKELQLEIEKAISSDRESSVASLDMKMKNKLTKKGSQISKELLLNGLLKPFPGNCISLMTISGAKGSTVNFQQISSYLGQQELEGKRVPRMVSGKTLPSFPPWDFASRAGGYITDRFLSGLRPQEYYFHCMAGREGLVDTAVKTSRSGYLQRCLIKNLESLKVCYDYTVRDSDGSIVQFCYGEDGIDVHRTSFLKNFKALSYNQDTISQKFYQKRDFNSYIEDLPIGLQKKTEEFIKSSKMKHGKKFMKLVEQKYLSSLAPSGEPVGVIAAQSVGEPSTQMTLNTFHLAGRGEMNVTLGIPRLQEILMTASDVIKTPILTCPFRQWRSRHEARSLVAKVKKVSIADLIENMEVHLLPLKIHKHEVCRIYKLKMKLKEHEFVSIDDCERACRGEFRRELEDAIEAHIVLLSKISGIKNFVVSSQSKSLDEDESDSGKNNTNDDDDDDDDVDDDDDDSDVLKQKQQANDDIDYGDVSSDDDNKSTQLENDETEDSLGEVNEDMDVEKETKDEKSKSESKSKSKSKKKKKFGGSFASKDSDRAIFDDFEGLIFEIHFRFTNEPHVLLAQIAQRTAKKVFIKSYNEKSSSNKMDNCRMVGYDVNENTVFWNDEKKKKDSDVESEEDGFGYWALKATGVNFGAFWELQDDLDVTRLYSNNIHAMLATYGVEAARATIMREVKTVFGIYGVEIDFRHLSLIADYMTHTGGYRPMSRHGSIAESLSPFIKMSFETASKFIVEAASHGISDDLDTPSARVCLGLPVKMGTGCFDVMQNLEF